MPSIYFFFTRLVVFPFLFFSFFFSNKLSSIKLISRYFKEFYYIYFDCVERWKYWSITTVCIGYKYTEENSGKQFNRLKSSRPWYEILDSQQGQYHLAGEILYCRDRFTFSRETSLLARFLYRFSTLRTDVGVRFCHRPVTDQLCACLKV